MMTAEPSFVLHPQAAQDITNIWSYISEFDPQAAGRVREELLKAILGLVAFPNKGFKRQDLTSRPLRFTMVRDFLIAYAQDENPLWILAVIHTRRNPRVVAAVLKDRVSK